MKPLSSLLILLLCSQVFAAQESNEKSDELKKLKSQYVQSKQKFIEVDQKQRKILASVYDINQKIKKMSFRRGRLTDIMLSATKKVKNIAHGIALLDGEISKQRAVLSKRLMALYKTHEYSFLPAIFSANSPHDLDRNLKYLKLISETDYELIKNYETKVSKLKRERDKLKTEVTRLMKVREKLKQQEDLLDKKQKTRSLILSSLAEKKRNQLVQIKKIRRQSESVADEDVEDLLASFGSSFFEKKGQISYPAEGSVSQSYGLIHNDRYRYTLSHKGIFIQTSKAELVKSVHKGKVAFAGNIQGYGKTVIIDHGDHYYTVYSHLANLLVAKGQSLEGGVSIGKAGVSTNHDASTGVYFEIRHFSDAIDPKPWLKAEGQDLARND